MTVNFIEEDPSGRKATNQKGVRTYSRAFKLETTSQSEGPYAVGSHVSLPKIGSAYPDDAGAWCTTLQVDNTDPWTGWTVTAEYSSERELSENPTEDAMQIRVYTEQFQKPAVFNKDDELIVNSAGDPYDPPPMMDDSRRVISLVRNVSAHPSWVLDYQDAVNSDTFTVRGITYAIGTGKVQSVSISDAQKRNGHDFYTLEVLIHLQKNGWILKNLDAGFREIAYGGGRKNILNSDDNERVTAPVPLDGNGQPLDDPSPTNNVLRSDVVYDTLPFSVLFA